MVFWKPKPTIDADDETWQIDAWMWLLSNLGGREAMRSHSVMLPIEAHFPPSGKSGLPHVEYVFRQVAERFEVDPEGFELRLQDSDIDPVLNPLAVAQNVPVDPLGTYSVDDKNKHLVTVAPKTLNELEGLIATLAHEICHPVLFSISIDPPGGPELEEFATDLAMVFFGFGVFGANSSFRFSQFSDAATGSQGWAVNRAGYLSQAEWGYALAVRTVLLGEDLDGFADYLSDGARAHYRKNLRYLMKKPDTLSSLLL